MKITRAARTILSITALAWAIPLAQADDKATPRVGSAKFIQLDTNRDAKLDVSVETFKGEVMLSGFVKDQSQRAKAVKAASTVAGVAGVKDGLAVRN